MVTMLTPTARRHHTNNQHKHSHSNAHTPEPDLAKQRCDRTAHRADGQRGQLHHHITARQPGRTETDERHLLPRPQWHRLQWRSDAQTRRTGRFVVQFGV